MYQNINIYDKESNLLANFDKAEIFKYFHFYVGKVISNFDYVYVRITESESQNILFSNFMKIHK